jgi:hypothetical protein
MGLSHKKNMIPNAKLSFPPSDACSLLGFHCVFSPERKVAVDPGEYTRERGPIATTSLTAFLIRKG